MKVNYLEWDSLLRKEYLRDFVKAGGAAVKFATTDSHELGHRLYSNLTAAAAEQDYLMAIVDSAQVKIHLMQDLFHQVARQIDWEKLARCVVRQCYQNQGHEITGDDLRVESVASLNGLTTSILRQMMHRDLDNLLRRSDELARDFRYAMLWLCMAQVTNAEGGGTNVEIALQWLKGELRLLSSAKRLLIFEKIGRHNARAMLSSLGSWCRMAGKAGLVLLLDIRQLAAAKHPESGLYYGATACMDAYEVIRQLIDSTDDLAGFLAVILASPDLFEDDKRGVKAYKALYERIWPDVRLRSHPNPLSALASLAVEVSK